MSTKKQKNKNIPSSRAAKRERFASPEKKGPGGPSPLILIAGIAVSVLIIGGAIFALSSPSPAAGESAPVGSSAAADSEVWMVSAATAGHDPYPLVKAVDGVVRLPLSNFDDYKAHHYTYMNQGHPIEFFVLKSADGVVRAAFNACDVCFGSKKGYTQDGDHMICNNCGRRFPADQINVVHGGCNPSPLIRTVEGDNLVIRVEDIVAGADYF